MPWVSRSASLATSMQALAAGTQLPSMACAKLTRYISSGYSSAVSTDLPGVKIWKRDSSCIRGHGRCGSMTIYRFLLCRQQELRGWSMPRSGLAVLCRSGAEISGGKTLNIYHLWGTLLIYGTSRPLPSCWHFTLCGEDRTRTSLHLPKSLCWDTGPDSKLTYSLYQKAYRFNSKQLFSRPCCTCWLE